MPLVSPAPGVVAMNKTCNRCLLVLPVASFYRNHKAADGRQSSCIDCKKQYNQDNTEAIAERQLSYQRRLRGARPHPIRIPGVTRQRLRKLRKYGLTLGDFEWLLISQGSRCAICHQRCELCIDHDHATGEVRGLLCYQCNGGLGMFRDDPRRLASAIDYLAVATSRPPMDELAPLAGVIA